MNDALIGEEVTLEAAPGTALASLVVSAVAAFLEAATGASGQAEPVDSELHEAVATYGSGAERVRARLVIVRQGLEIHLSANGGAESVRTVRWRA